MLEKLHPDSFTWSRWRAFNISEEFKIVFTYSDIIRHRYIWRKYAVGYIEGEKLICRPKKDHYAVLFFNDGIFSWCHLTKKEFHKIFGEIK